MIQWSVANAQQTENGLLKIEFSTLGGHYSSNIQLSLKSAPTAKIFYTIDGAKPSERSNLYANPIEISKTCVVKAIASDGKQFSPVYTHTFLINEPSNDMPVVSVSMSPSTLFHPLYGIMQEGAKANTERENKPGANFWTRKEYLCNVEVFEPNQTCVHNSLAGFRIFGGYSRVFPQKSFVLVARKRYGSKKFDGEILPQDNVEKYKYLVLRNGGSDWSGAHFRDELMSSLMDSWNIEKQGYRPAVVYLNGQYWGIYHIREKINTRFLGDHTNIDSDSIDLLEHRNTVRSGSIAHYDRMLNFIQTHHLSNQSDYEEVKRMMDVDNFIDYQIAQIYCVNQDAGGNIRYWRPQTKDGKWRWIFFDMDWGLGLHSPKAFATNSIKFFTKPDGPEWPNPPWSTLLFRNLLQNPEFQARFINRMCDRLNTDFSSQHVLGQIERFQNGLAPEMTRHLNRWELKYTDWEHSVNTMKQFAIERPHYLFSHLEEFFQLGAQTELQVMPANGGYTVLNGAVNITDTPYKGLYYEDIPVEIEAKPHKGYKFVGWDGWPDKKEKILLPLQSGKILRIRPRFEAYVHPLADVVIFNEVSPYNKKSSDWIELYNTSNTTIDITGWKISDQSQHNFTLPQTQIGPKGFVVVCRDAVKLRAIHPLIDQPIIDGLSFGLDKSMDVLTLSNTEGYMIDSMSYRVEPALGAYTIDLLLPSLDNSMPTHWGVHLGNGSPGMDNPLLFSQLTGSQKELWVRLGLGISLALFAIAAIWWKKGHRRQKV